LKKIASYFLIGLAFIVIAFFRKYTGNVIPYPFLFYLFGFLLFIAGFLLLRSDRLSSQIKSRKELEKTITELRMNGDKISVDFSQCEIKENNYLVENDKSDYVPSRTNIIEGFATLLKKSGDLRPDQTEVEQSVLIYLHQNQTTGTVERFISPVISKDKISLSFYLDQQKQTTLYVDKKDRSKYYFDLVFLFKQDAESSSS
jgi:hypothetical protein